MKYNQAAEVCKSLGHSKRLYILEIVKNQSDISLVEICDRLDEDIKNISFHVAKLYRGGLLTKHQEGNFVRLQLTKLGQQALTFVRMLE